MKNLYINPIVIFGMRFSQRESLLMFSIIITMITLKSTIYWELGFKQGSIAVLLLLAYIVPMFFKED